MSHVTATPRTPGRGPPSRAGSKAPPPPARTVLIARENGTCLPRERYLFVARTVLVARENGTYSSRERYLFVVRTGVPWWPGRGRPCPGPVGESVDARGILATAQPRHTRSHELHGPEEVRMTPLGQECPRARRGVITRRSSPTARRPTATAAGLQLPPGASSRTRRSPQCPRRPRRPRPGPAPRPRQGSQPGSPSSSTVSSG